MRDRKIFKTVLLMDQETNGALREIVRRSVHRGDNYMTYSLSSDIYPLPFLLAPLKIYSETVGVQCITVYSTCFMTFSLPSDFVIVGCHRKQP